MKNINLENFFTNLTLIASGFMFLFIFISKFDIALPLILLFFLILFFEKTKFEFKKFSILLFALSMIMSVSYCLIIQTPVTSDFKLILDASQSLLEGDLSFTETIYFKTWAYQMFWVIFQAGILSIWNNIFALKLVSCIFLSFCNVFIYNISLEYFSEKSSKAVSLIHLLFLAHLTHITILSNTIFSIFFMYLAIYILICNKLNNLHIIARYSIIGILVSIGNMLRPDGIIIVLSFLAFSLVEFCENKQDFKNILTKVATFLLSYLLIFQLTSGIISITGIHEDGLANNNPLWKFVLGFNHTTGGTYSSSDLTLINDLQVEFDISQDEAELMIIKDRVFVSPLKLLMLFRAKIHNFWSANTLYWSLGYLPESFSGIYKVLNSFNTSLFNIILFLSPLGVLNLTLNKSMKSSKKCFFLFILLATFIVYLFIETQSRYSYFVQFILFFLATGGIDFILNCIYKNHKS